MLCIRESDVNQNYEDMIRQYNLLVKTGRNAWDLYKRELNPSWARVKAIRSFLKNIIKFDTAFNTTQILQRDCITCLSQYVRATFSELPSSISTMKDQTM